MLTLSTTVNNFAKGASERRGAAQIVRLSFANSEGYAKSSHSSRVADKINEKLVM